MRCPFCAHDDSQVKDSRPTEDNTAIRRRRQCESCGARFTTFERVQLRDITVVKSNDAREPFDSDLGDRLLRAGVDLEGHVGELQTRVDACGLANLDVGVALVPQPALEIVAGGWMLDILGAEVTPTTKQLFATLGMFMIVVGGLVAQVLRRPLPDPDVLMWGGLQKLGAFVAVLIAVVHGVFSSIAMAVATFDLLTGVLMALLWVDVRRRTADGAGGLGGGRASATGASR